MIHMSPRWGLGYWGCPYSINMSHLWCLMNQSTDGHLTVYTSRFTIYLFYRHAAPLGLGGLGVPIFYKHVAPLVLFVPRTMARRLHRQHGKHNKNTADPVPPVPIESGRTPMNRRARRTQRRRENGKTRGNKGTE